MTDIFIGRQPIFNQELRVYAYELLFRDGEGKNIAKVINGEEATAQVLLSTFADMGLEQVVGEAKAVINFTEGLLKPQIRHLLPRKRIVVEVLEDTPVTANLLHTLKTLREHGYTIALDDYMFHPELAPLEDYADLIKVDIQLAGPHKMIEHTQRLKDKGIRLLAEKVETQEQYLFCKQLGYDLFQGYFFAKPKIIKGKALPPNKLSVLELINKLYDPDISLTELGKVISHDVALSEKLMKFTATIVDNPMIKISSVQDAVLRFGLDRLQSWGSMLALSAIEDKPPELFKTALIRAKFCELLGEKVGKPAKETFYTVGLFSTLEALMDYPLKNLLASMRLSPEVEQALLEHKGVLGEVLDIILRLEQNQSPKVLPPSLTSEDVRHALLAAMEEAQKVKLN